MGKVEYHDFYCMNCGNKYTLPRRANRKKESMHRKVLYCPFCKKEVNHIEVKNYLEKQIFLENFQKGLYYQECQESLLYTGSLQ